MTRRVNFTSHSVGGKPSRLPDINKGQNWVSNKQAQRRFHSEPPQRKEFTGSLPAGVPSNRPIGPPSDAPFANSSSNHSGNHRGPDQSHTRRLQSLPPRKPKADNERARSIKSAPDKDNTGYNQRSNPLTNQRPVYNQSPNQLANQRPVYNQSPNQLANQRPGYNSRPGQAFSNSPTHPRSRIADQDMGPAELQQKTHGIATRSYEENYLRSNKFASSWARVRADNPTFMEHPPGQMPYDKRVEDSQSPDRTPNHHPTNESPTNRETAHPSEHRKKEAQQQRQQQQQQQQHRGRITIRRRLVKKHNQKLSGSRSPAHSPKSQLQEDNQYEINGAESASDGNDEDEDDDDNDDDGAANKDDDGEQDGQTKSPRRRPWNKSVVVSATTKPPPKLDAKRCKDDLTFKPTVNTDHVVSKTYTGQDGLIIRDRALPEEYYVTLTDDEEGYNTSPGGNDEPRSNDNSPERTGKEERMLNRREAQMYIKMTNVYGSDAFKNQRKEWFIQRLNQVQETKTKLSEQEKRNVLKKREEDRQRQQRQLNYVRSKFRRKQMHRFQTQYVTARVLEYEQASRHVYGLPEDFEDLAYLLKDEENDVEPYSETDDDPSRNENRLRKDTKDKNGVISDTNGVTSDQKTNKRRHGGKPDKQSLHEARALKEHQQEQERLARIQQNQSAWYAQTDTSPQRQQSPTSHGTSGYESGKSPSEHNGNTDGEPLSDTKLEANQKGGKIAGKQQQPQRHPLQDKSHGRLTSQKQIYEKAPQTRQKQIAAMRAENVENRINQRKHKDGKSIDNTTKATKANNVDNGGDERLVLEQEPYRKGYISNDAMQNYLKQAKQYKQSNKQNNVATERQIKNASNKGTLAGKSNPATDNIPDSQDKNPHKNRNQYSNPGDGDGKNISSEDSSNPRRFQNKESDKNIDKNSHQTKPDNSNQENNKNTQNPSDSADRTSALKTDEISTLPVKPAAVSNDSAPAFTKKARPEDEVPPNIKRIPLAGTLSKENAPATFGATAQRLEDSVPSDDRNPHSTRVQSISPDKPPHSTRVQSISPDKPSHSTRVQSISPDKPSKLTSVPENKPPIKTSDQKSHNLNAGKSSTDPVKPVSDDTARRKTANSKDTSGKEDVGLRKAVLAPKVIETSTNKDKPKGHSAKSISSDISKQAKAKKKESLADKMFNMKTGPTWNPKSKVPKMEGIDTVVVTGKDGKGRIVKKKRNVNDVVREASNLLKVADKDNTHPSGTNARRPLTRPHSPAVTLGSDFDIDDDDDDDKEDDIFERLRRKYNIKIDSDEEDDNNDDHSIMR